MSRRELIGRVIQRTCDACGRIAVEGEDLRVDWWWANVTLGGPEGAMPPTPGIEADTAECLAVALTRLVLEFKAATSTAANKRASPEPR